MTMIISPTLTEIDDVLNRCVEAEDNGESIFPGMSYEQGVKAALEWVNPNTTGRNPLDE